MKQSFFLPFAISRYFTISSTVYTDPTLARNKRRKVDRIPEQKQDSKPAVNPSHLPMSIDKATRQWSSTDSAPDITVSKFEASEDESAETLQSRGRPTTRNQSKLDKAKRSKSNPGTEEPNLSHTITNRQASCNTSKNAGNNTKGHNSTHLKIHTSPASSPEGVSEDVESSSSVDRKRKQPQSNQLKGRSIPTIQLFSDKILSESSVSHDEENMMFKVDLDGNGSLGE